MSELLPQVTDRLSMRLFFDKLFTTRGKRPSLKAIVLLSKVAPLRLKHFVLVRKRLKSFDVSVSPLDQDLYRVHISRVIRDRVFEGHVLLDTSREGVWIAFTNEQTYFVTHVAERFFDRLYPNVSRLFLNYSQMRAFMEDIKRAYMGSTAITSFSVKRQPKSWKLTETTLKRGTSLLWELDADEELVRQSKEFRLTVDRLNFDIRDTSGMLLLRANIARKGVCRLRFGDFTSFYENVVQKAIDFGLHWKEFYGERERRVRDGEIRLSPFRIVYTENLDTEPLRRLSRQLSRSYSCSIVHGGNPYFVANVCDYDEGSSFGVTALGNVVTITPIVRATPEAIWKLADELQVILGDGDIVDVID